LKVSFDMSTLRASRLLLAATLLLGACSSSDDVLRPRAVAFIGITPGAFLLNIGESRQMTAIVRDANGAVLTDRSIRWSVDDSTAARISAAGRVTGIAHGYVAITATSEGKSTSIGATIVQPELSRQ
jgi:uncharacterized protein YjdB